MNSEHRPIKFNRHWRGRQPGQVDLALVYGVAEQLVQRRIADWQDSVPALGPASQASRRELVPAAPLAGAPEVIGEARRRRRA
jgi:hypothetical protein